jgi:hypothetical protein
VPTYYVDGAVGDNGNDGEDEGAGNAWATIDYALNNIVAGDKVWVKASATYTENPELEVEGALTTPIVFEGYTSSPGDGGRASIVGEIGDGVIDDRLYYVFVNFDISNSGGAGSGRCVVFNDPQSSNTCWKNCVFHDNNAFSLLTLNAGPHIFESCEFNDATGDGVVGVTLAFVGCKFDTIAASAIDASGPVFCFFCEFFDVESNAIDGGAAADTFLIAVNNTIDGNDQATAAGILKGSGIHGPVIAINNIVYDCTNGMSWGCKEPYGISLNNLVNANTDDYVQNAFTSSGEVTDAPAFTAEGSNDYSLAAGSPALSAGFDLQNNADIGAHQASAAGGGGGGTTSRIYRGEL